MIKHPALLKKVLIFQSIILLLIISVTSLSSNIFQNESVNIIQNNYTYYVGGIGQGNFTTIQDAIDFANNGDTIFVFDDSSPYYENILIDKSISLIGENKQSTIIDGMELGNVVEINANNVDITKFTIQNCSKGYSAGIIGSTNFSTITNNNIVSNNWSGLVLKYSHFNMINNNIINSNRWLGIYLGTCNNNLISDNRIISNVNEGFYQYNSHNNTISGNLVSKNEYGIHIGSYCKNNNLSGNIVLFNEYGIRFYESYGNNTIRNNCIRFNMYGISMQYSYLNRIENNNFVRNIFNAYHEGYYLHENRTNYWNGNFWNRPRILPKIIFGQLWTYGPFTWDFDLDIDRNPALIPNRIGE
jgi:parallel beta-helix repeat protein